MIQKQTNINVYARCLFIHLYAYLLLCTYVRVQNVCFHHVHGLHDPHLKNLKMLSEKRCLAITPRQSCCSSSNTCVVHRHLMPCCIQSCLWDTRAARSIFRLQANCFLDRLDGRFLRRKQGWKNVARLVRRLEVGAKRRFVMKCPHLIKVSNQPSVYVVAPVACAHKRANAFHCRV